MNIFVSGGTGFIGSEIVHRLLREPNPARITVGTRVPERHKEGDSRISRTRVDVRDSASLERATQGQEVVIHCVQFPNAPVPPDTKIFMESLLGTCEKKARKYPGTWSRLPNLCNTGQDLWANRLDSGR